MFLNTVRDDAGARVRRRFDAEARRRVKKSRPKAVRLAADWKVARSVYGSALLLGVPLIAATLLMSWLLKPVLQPGAYTIVALSVVTAIFVVLTPIALRWLSRGERAWFTVMACCPACCYDMVGLVVREDGLAVCPECGGAWNMGAASAAQPGEEPTSTGERNG